MMSFPGSRALFRCIDRRNTPGLAAEEQPTISGRRSEAQYCTEIP